MSICRVLVGLAAESALPSSLFVRRNHGFGAAGTVMRLPRTAAIHPFLASRRPWQSKRTSPHRNTPPLPHVALPPPDLPPLPSLPSPPPRIHPHSSASDTATPLPDQFRSLMRLVTHSVVVCTSTLPGSSNGGGSTPPAPRAMTMSSFTSLSLLPSPVISFNIATPSRTYDAVAASRRFNVHVLADDPSGARIADWLAKGNASGREVFNKLAGECRCEVDMGAGNEPPVLKGNGVLYVLRCKLLDQPAGGLVRVRDHVIVLGEVVEITEAKGVEGETEERFGLLYADRRYRQLGNCIIPGEEEEE
ncbi:FMN reductase (NADH) NtaB [Madurella mycetomatis]|uniref:FMN reductase (NADH) NtaB n=1 Tax=Madurella mycetomatis TaxID=100816 RepID=A0A175VSE4_9PEZI|nr:FMN reductase (NADH) NtaB [Madurella mycetomatis]